MKLATATTVLKLLASGTVALGFLFVFAPHTGLKPLGLLFVDLGFWPLDGAQNFVDETTQLAMAIAGGLLVGLGVVIWLITTRVFCKDPRLGRQLLIPTLLAWYIPDSLGSWLSGAGFNVVMNTVFIALFLLPLLLSIPATSRQSR